MCCWGRDGTSCFAQLRLLLWKNWLLKKRRLGATCCELLFPVGAVFILIIIRTLVKIDDVNDLIPVEDKALASANLPIMLASMACGIVGSITDRYPFQSLAFAAGPSLVGGDQSYEIQSLKNLTRDTFAAVGLPLNYSVPCCIIPKGDTYGPGCYRDVRDYVLNPNSELVQTFPSEEAMEDYIQTNDYGWYDDVTPIFLGVVVDRDLAHPNRWTYTLRANSSDVPFTGTALNTLVSNYSRSDFFTYYDNHVLTFQWMIEGFMLFEGARNPATEEFAKTAPAADSKFAFGPSPSLFASIPQTVKDTVKAATLPLWDISFVSFPYAAHRQDNFKQYVGQIFGLFLVVAFMWPFSRMMKMMGLRNSVFWMSWVVTYLISFAIVCILVIAISKLSLFKYSDSGLLFLFFFSFCLSLISLACLVTTFFSRAKTAGTLSPFVLLAAYLPYFSVSDPSKAEGVKNLSCLLSPVAFSLGSTQLISFEGVFIGSQWNNSNDVIDNFRLSSAISLMFFDAILYGVLAWYLDKIWPREYGTHLKWYFFLTPKYWKGCCSCICGGGSRKKKTDDQLFNGTDTPKAGLRGISVTTASPVRAFSSGAPMTSYGTPGVRAPLLYGNDSPSPEDQDEVDPDFGPDYEPVPENMRAKVGVKVRGLRKEFSRDGNEVVAVKGLDLNLYQGQCFVLLGHNGAGKTTTISMLTGMIETSAGKATLYGRDINEDMNEIRTFMGVCPQHDVLFDDLTVYEHLEFFGKLKGILRTDLHKAVMTAIEEVQLLPKITTKSSDLSGGQRRRLSLAIALIGDSKVVFLDEPTSGVDPFSRRAIWDLLTKKKQGRILVLTTHFMDEADQLGDRIGIMHHGAMKCCGTSLFLKAKYGVGYCMTLVKDPNHSHVDEVTQLVQSRVPQATVLSSVGSELSYSLPFSASAVFPELLGKIDENLEKLGLINYGLSVTTMEEVFIKVAQDHDPNDAHNKSKSNLNEEKENGSLDLSTHEALATDPSTHQSSWCTHFRALLAKRYHIQKRDKKALCCQFLVPLILLALGMGLLRIPPNFDFPSLALDTGVNGPYNIPNRIPYNEGLDPNLYRNIHTAAGQYVEGMPELFPDGGAGTGQYDLYNFSYALLQNRTEYAESRYGAFFGTSLQDHQFNETFWEFTVMTNASATHGLPTWANLGHQALLRYITGDTTASISASIHPFSWTYRQKEAIQSLNGLFASIVISLAFTFIPASFAVFIVSEREYKSKHLQLISGVSMSSYWVANFVWDFFAFVIPTALACAIIYAYNNPELIQNFDVIVVTFMCYGLSIIPFTYMLSFLFSSHSTAQNVMIMVYILGGIIMTSTAFALYLVPSTTNISKTYLRHFFRLIPSFCLGDAIFYLSVMPFLDGQPTKWSLIVSGFDILYMLGCAIVYFILTLTIDKLSSIPSFVGLFKKDPEMEVKHDEEPEDEDIKAERERLQSTTVEAGEDKFRNLTDAIEAEGAERALSHLPPNDPRSDLIRIEGLRKVYPKKTAVKDIYFGIPAGQCFGFLGVNGAGKTTTLKILTGDVTPSQGKAFIGGYDIAHYPAQVRRLMGYCPQFDAIFDNLTARETLYFYGKIRGIPERKMERMVTFLIDRLSLTEYADRPAGTYSGGNKRKLSVAIALIGNPPVVFLDEPSTGMDPVSRRFMWDFISETMTHRAVILTTHSMEECEALCSRIGILVNGALKCVGSSQHLKSRFGRGFQVDISTASNDTTQARQFLLQYFPDAEKLEDYGGKMKYKILHHTHRVQAGGNVSPQPQWKLKDIFALIESHKESVGISEYSVGQTTLEQIFIRFAKRGDIEEFGGKVMSEEEEEELAAQAEYQRNQANGLLSPPDRKRMGSFGTEDSYSNRIVTPSSFGYIPADAPSLNA